MGEKSWTIFASEHWPCETLMHRPVNQLVVWFVAAPDKETNGATPPPFARITSDPAGPLLGLFRVSADHQALTALANLSSLAPSGEF